MEQQEILRMVNKAWDSAWRNIDSVNIRNAKHAQEIVAASSIAAKQAWDACWYHGGLDVRDAAWEAAWAAWNKVWDGEEDPDLSTWVMALTAALAAANTVAIIELSEARVSAPRAEKGRQGQPWILA